ncbi:serine hydrolase domain-containing protein [Dyella telluris]|uniref:Beta-lactamase family protein n=1 Tax=Dyella telluris TaxID=2763498 RepID=A0A7G8Q7F8_9GAMM|nr:serine hydrolase domain-containing protein [Dyella telluris]QNK02716.1 beta-lactamase family protein [Dyella telluris]
MTFRTLPLLIAATLAFAGTTSLVRAATPTNEASVPTSSQGVPADRMKDTLAAYQQWLDRLDQRNAVAGLATAVVADNKVVFEGTIGYADAATREPVTPETVFRLASLSKAFATALTGVLVNDGKLSWDTKLVSVLPFFRLKSDSAAEHATVRDILGQRLGLPKNTYDNMLEENVSYEELARRLDEVTLTCDVGQCYGYQNIAFSLIGDVVYAQTGDFFTRQVDKNIFFPLGMKTASYGREGLEASKSWAHPHRPSGNGWIPFEPKEAYYRVAPAAGVNASLKDMEQWLIAQMGGRPDVLPPALLATLHAPEVATPVEMHSAPWRRARLEDASYALGWRVFDYEGETLIFHAGAVEGYRTMIGFLPKYHVGMVMMWNSADPLPAGLLPMVFDSLLGLPHVDWAGIESDAPTTHTTAKGKARHKGKTAATTSNGTN